MRFYYDGKKSGTGLKKSEKYVQIQTVFDEFCDRMGSQNQFHGVDKPDAADFRAFSIINRVQHTREIKQLLNQRENK